MKKQMTEEQRTAFIKDKLVPLFDGMNAGDVVEIICDFRKTEQVVLSQFTVSQCQQED